MEVTIIPRNLSSDFDFNNTISSSSSTPSTPKRFGECFLSASNTPNHQPLFYGDYEDEDDLFVATTGNDAPASLSPGQTDFEFDVSGGDSDKPSLYAEDLFEGGVIKPLDHRPRGRERGAVDPQKSSRRRAARSLSPTNTTTPAPLRGQRKWRLKDFFLFRSASEGRAADKDPLKKYTAAFRQSSDGSRTGSRGKGPVSAHELHYMANRAVSEDLKKKTFLPYKQGILGRVAFNPAVHAMSNGFGFSRK